MAITKMEGFDLTGTTLDDLKAKGGYNAVVGTISTTGGKFGGGEFTCVSTTSGLAWSAPSFLQYITMSGWIKTPATLASSKIYVSTDIALDISASNTDLSWGVGLTSTGAWQFVGDGGAVRASTDSGLIAGDTWYHIEVQVNSNSSGNMTLFVDGVEVLNNDSDYFESSVSQSFFALGGTGGITHDDIVIQRDASAVPALLGTHRIESLLPDGNTAQADWTGAFGDIDDALGAIHDGDTTNINSATLNDKSEFGMENLAASPTTVFAVQTVMVSSKTDSGSKAVTPYLVSNSVRGDGVEFNPAEGSYLFTSDIFELDPDGSVAWTETTVNAVLFGVEITT